MTSRLSRREFIKLTIAVGTTASVFDANSLALANPAPCQLTPEQEVGPYWIDGALMRSDIREGKPGVALTLDIVLTDKRTCAPLVGAAVDIWQCDAMGIYSGYTKTAAMPPPPDFASGAPGRPPAGMPFGVPPGGFQGQPGRPPGPPPPTDHLTFLRGMQHTDRSGAVRFETIVPGVYPGRTNHIHFKVRTPDAQHAKGTHVSHVGQLFLPEALMVQLMQTDPYRAHSIRRTTSREDPVFTDQHGSSMIASVNPFTVDGRVKPLRACVEAVVDPDATPQPVEPRFDPNFGPRADSHFGPPPR
ncbi:intradiol ring-cleavage dioxygenase [Paraburkholderia tropica]|uniref:intradiol ring-cleavage dioxygenase n=1 Tax=Paraburkholderia tropica TaxID=92647 RepID=UPI002AB6551F|nr:intradiol ring-cleavage dioxygenase [Paraburkholderia tropica]